MPLITPETRLQRITGETESIFSRTLYDKIALIRGEGSIVPKFEIPAKGSNTIDRRLANILTEDNEGGTVEVTVFSSEVKVFNPRTVRSLFVSGVKPYLRMDGLFYSSPAQQAADAFLQAVSSDEFQHATSRIDDKEKQFAAFNAAYEILQLVTSHQPKP